MVSKKCNTNPDFGLVFQLWILLEVSLKLGRFPVSGRIPNFSNKFWLWYFSRESMFYLRNISKCERYTEIVLYLYFPHTVSVVWITSRIVGTLQHPRGIWDWATTKIRCCREKWERINLQEPLQKVLLSCTWAVCASFTAIKRQVPCWLQVVVYRSWIKTNICFLVKVCFHVAFGIPTVVDFHPWCQTTLFRLDW